MSWLWANLHKIFPLDQGGQMHPLVVLKSEDEPVCSFQFIDGALKFCPDDLDQILARFDRQHLRLDIYIAGQIISVDLHSDSAINICATLPAGDVDLTEIVEQCLEKIH